ncbi:hypothetical protein [Asticcacaulis sp. EMRT-3]|uniref:hypothetical protein n=1 Tax=Asticcacaulis sp. EMRT-3 TaxID=3040349 RepID=UPI0024AF8F32|nr:hypothetical protein [Asticcacaulis sp. EMRT-3]MDI7774671.1 hypothetical protein [Asticcacaulis sp. EMRT-3]
MERLTTIELESCTLIELAALYFIIETESWVDKVGHRQRPASFANQEKVRRSILHRNGPSGTSAQQR